MTSATSIETINRLPNPRIQESVGCAIDQLFTLLPNPEQLSTEERRGIMARYASVLEGNFIYWMTGAYLSVKSEEARSKIIENLYEEVRDCHPGMLRRFVVAARAVPTDLDAGDVQEELAKVRLFIGRLAGVPIVVTMAFFEGFIQRFMAYLAKLAEMGGSSEMEYTDVHGVCDIGHTEGLFRALDAEMLLNPPLAENNLFEGVELLRNLILKIAGVHETNSAVVN